MWCNFHYGLGVDTTRQHLEATARRLDLFEVDVPSGPGWHPLADALDPGWMGARIARLVEGAGHGPRPLAACGAYLGADLAARVVTPLATMIVTERRALDVTLTNVAVRFDDDGWPTRMAVAEPRFAVLPGDPAVRNPGVSVLPDEDALIDWAASHVVETFTPVFASVRATSRYGTSGLWGALADQVASVLWLLHERGASPTGLDRAWTVAAAFVEAIQRLEPRLKARPRRFRFASARPVVDLPMRGTCCLYYTTPEAAADEGDGMCNTCPRRDDEERVRLVNERLAAEAAPG